MPKSNTTPARSLNRSAPPLLKAAGAALLPILLGAWLAVCSEPSATIVIDTTERFQEISGWEVSVRHWEQDKGANRYNGEWLNHREEILDRLINEVGINRVRIEVRSGFENPVDHWTRFQTGEYSYTEWRTYRYEKINDNADPRVRNSAGFQFSELDYQVTNTVLPMRELLEARGERLYINLCFVDFRPEGNGGDVEFAHAPEEYAELVLAAFDHLQERYGFTPDALELVLEPENTPNWRGRNIGRALVAVAARLRQAGYTPEFIAPSTTHARAAPSYIDDMMDVPGAAEAISTFAYHSYDNPSDRIRMEIWARAERFGASTAMLEHFPSNAAELLRDLTVARVSAWQAYGISYPDSPWRDQQGAFLLLVNPERTAGNRVRMAWRTRGVSQIFRTVRRGAVRIGATSSSARMPAVAFENPNGGLVVAIVAAGGGQANITGLPANEAFEITFTSDQGAERNAIPVVWQGEALRVLIPSAGVAAVRQLETDP